MLSGSPLFCLLVHLKIVGRGPICSNQYLVFVLLSSLV